jgi:hypothetical protein
MFQLLFLRIVGNQLVREPDFPWIITKRKEKKFFNKIFLLATVYVFWQGLITNDLGGGRESRAH